MNIDGGGSRVAPMIFGPRKVIMVVGANKIVKDVDCAIDRTKQIWAPMNAMRHGLQHHDVEFLDFPGHSPGFASIVAYLREYIILPPSSKANRTGVQDV